MEINPTKHNRHSIRLKGYDYSLPGAYFITLVTYQRECKFGEIIRGEMTVNIAGQVVWDVWNSLPDRYPKIELGEAVVMPNHFHGIIWIKPPVGVGAVHELPQREPPQLESLQPEEVRQRRRQMLLPKVIGYFKMNTAKRINTILDTSGLSVWQRDYFERIIRDEREFNTICRYIHDNPLEWELDRENPRNPKTGNPG